MFLTIENNIPLEENLQGVVGKTKKADKEHHGYGLYNIYEIVGKYHGRIEYRQEGEIVKGEIVFGNILKEK